MEFSRNNQRNQHFRVNRPIGRTRIGSLFPINHGFRTQPTQTETRAPPNRQNQNHLGTNLRISRARTQNSNSADNTNETIKCPKCSLQITLIEIGVHTENCNYQICNFCAQYFPGDVLSQHIEYSAELL